MICSQGFVVHAFRYLRQYSARAVGILAGLLVWELLGRAEVSVIIPPVTQTVVTAVATFQEGDFQRNLIVSIVNLLVGFGLSAIFGIAIGLIMAHSRTIQHFLDPYLSIGLAAPPIAFIPLLVLLFGTGGNVRIAIAFVFSAPVIIVNTFTGVREAQGNLLEMARSFGATPIKIFWHIRIPSALPFIFAGLRLGSSRAVNGVIVGEMLIAIVGLGAAIMMAASTFNGARLFSVLIAIGILAVALDHCLRSVQRLVAPWSTTNK